MLWICKCTTAYSVGAPSCPHCGSTEYTEEGMAKISRSSGPTLEGVVAAVVAAASEESSGEEVLVAEETPDPEVVVEDPPDADTPSEPEVPVAPGEPYDTWLLIDLQDELVNRGLPKSGNKAELVQRLIDADNLTGGPEESGEVDDEVSPVF